MQQSLRLIKAHSWPIGVFLVSRAGLFILAYLSLIYLPLNPDLNVWHTFPDNPALDGWSRWDSGWYLGIAESGYSHQPLNDQGQRNVVFFPLYPLTIRALDSLVTNGALSGIIVSNLAFGVALVLLFRLARETYDDYTGRWSVALLATFPFSFYFSAVYSESLFLLTVVGAFYLGKNRRWAAAALWGACASAARATGIVVSFGLLLLYLSEIDYDIGRIRADILWLLISPLGLIGYMGFLWYRFGDPLLFLTSRNVPGWEQGMGLTAIWQAIEPALSVGRIIAGNLPVINLLHIFSSGLAVLSILLSWRRLRLAHSLWALATILASFVAAWHGMGRYILPVFPIFISLPLLIRRPNSLAGLVYVNTCLLAFFTVLYTHFYWVS